MILQSSLTLAVSLLPPGPRLWNSYPAGLRQMDIRYEQFKRLLETFCLGVEIAADCDYLFNLHLSKFSYLLIGDVHHLQIVKLKFLTFRLTGSSGVTLITLGVDAHNLANTQH